jgi:hypothetical protein
MRAVGLDPRVTQSPESTRVETHVPESMSAEFWRDLLELLETGDSFGLTDGSRTGLRTWTAISKSPRPDRTP